MRSARILISYKIHPSTVPGLPADVLYRPELGYGLSEDDRAESPAELEQKKADQQTNLTKALTQIKPAVLIIGSNLVDEEAIRQWRAAAGADARLLIVRRGVEVGGIDHEACRKHQVSIQNIPGINSGPVARHLLEHASLDEPAYGNSISIIGAGAIGGYIAGQSLKRGLSVRIFSPSLSRPESRDSALKKAGLDLEPALSIEPDLSSALKGARRLAIAVPWHADKGFNQSFITDKDIESLELPAVIISASNPGVFSTAALKLMEALCRKKSLRVHIDTGAVYAKESIAKFPALEIEHDVAFSGDDCQMALDKASLDKARRFIEESKQ